METEIIQSLESIKSFMGIMMMMLSLIFASSITGTLIIIFRSTKESKQC